MVTDRRCGISNDLEHSSRNKRDCCGHKCNSRCDQRNSICRKCGNCDDTGFDCNDSGGNGYHSGCGIGYERNGRRGLGNLSGGILRHVR